MSRKEVARGDSGSRERGPSAMICQLNAASSFCPCFPQPLIPSSVLCVHAAAAAGDPSLKMESKEMYVLGSILWFPRRERAQDKLASWGWGKGCSRLDIYPASPGACSGPCWESHESRGTMCCSSLSICLQAQPRGTWHLLPAIAAPSCPILAGIWGLFLNQLWEMTWIARKAL